jgi:hypothetical protein
VRLLSEGAFAPEADDAAAAAWHSRRMVRGVAAAAAVSAVGCITGGATGRPIVEFPTQQRLADLEAQPASLPSIQVGDVPAEGWTMPAPALAAEPAADAWAPRGPWDQAFAAAYAASGRKAALTRAMACVAGELGRFYLEQHAPAPEPLQRFVTAGCGVFAPAVAYEFLKGTLPAGATDAAALPQWEDEIDSSLVDRVPAAAKQAGFWFGRRGSSAVALVVYEATPVELAPLSPVPDANGDLVIEGRLVGGDADYFEGYVNQGRFGVKNCLVDPAVPRPSFRVVCRMAPEDATAWIQIVYAPPRSVLVQPLVQVLARRDASKPLVYAEKPYAPARPVADAASFGPAVLLGLNATRAQAGLRPVRLAEAQSASAARVARQYFATALGTSGLGDVTAGGVEDLNTIALGLLAGWQVAGTIRDGTFFSEIVPGTRDAGRWVDSALSMPIGRTALMAPEIDEVAVGSAMFDNPAGLGAIACGYRFHHDNDHTADVNLLHDRITQARQRLNLPPAAHIPGMDAVIRRELMRVQEGDWTPMSALQASLQEATDRTHASTRGLVVETTSLDALQIPPEVLARPGLRLEIGVTHYKPPGAAWAQLVIIVVYVSPGGVAI